MNINDYKHGIDAILNEKLEQFQVSPNDSLLLKWIGNLYCDETELKKNEEMSICLDENGNIDYSLFVHNFNKSLNSNLNTLDNKFCLGNGLIKHKESIYALPLCKLLSAYGFTNEPKVLTDFMNIITTSIEGVYISEKVELTGEGLLNKGKFQIPPEDLYPTSPRWAVANDSYHKTLKDFTVNTSVSLDIMNTSAPYILKQYNIKKDLNETTWLNL